MDDNNASVKGTASARNACPTPAPDADATANANQSSQTQKTLVADNYDNFFNHSVNHDHSITSTYSYADDLSEAAQVYANNVQVASAPFVGYFHHQNRGGGTYNPCLWHYHYHPQNAVFAGHCGYGATPPGAPQLQPQPWPQPQPQPQLQLPVIDQLGFDNSNSYSSGGGRSVDSIVVNFCPSPSPRNSPGPGHMGCPSIKSWLQQRQRSHSAPPPSLELNHQLQLQPARLPSSSPPPYLAPHREYVPLLVSVRKLRNDETLKALIDNEDLLVMMNGCGTSNQTFTPNQSPPLTATGSDASTCQEGGTGSYSYPAEAAAVARPKKDLFIFHVPSDMTEGELYKLFSQYGKLRRARIHHDIIDGKSVSKGYGFVTFKRFSDAVVAVHSLNGYKVGEKNKKALTVTYCRDTPQKDPTITSVSVNSGTNRSSADKSKRKARRVERRLSS